jgi:glycosyltransferase involved in cell wall biosynthesis
MSGPRRPTASVLLRTYNHEPFIAQAIESVLIQDAGFPFELIIGEDCSTDRTRAVVEGYAAAYPDRIRTILPKRNVGHGEIFRALMSAASGDFVAYLDGDDYWTSRSKLARQVEFLERQPRCVSCFHDVSLIYDEAGLPSGTVSPGFAEEWFGLDQILMECFVPAPSMMFRRDLSDELLPWMYESAWIDWLIHIKAAERGQLGYIREALAAYRVHKGGMFSSLDRVSQLEEDLRFYRKLLPEMPEKRQLIERCLAYRGAQIAIERLGVPLDACIVLIDPRRELRPYFNGRHARNLPRREGHEVTELEAIRAAAVELPEAVGDYGSPLPASRGTPGCFVVVPRSSADWLRERPDLSSYLRRQGELAWEDAWVDVHELPASPGDGAPDGSRGACRVEVELLLRGGGAIPAAFLDAPASEALLPAHAVTVAGWVVGEAGPAASIDFELAGEVIWRAPVLRERPDVEQAFPELSASRPGFQTTLNTRDVGAGTVTVVAVFPDGTRLPFAELRFRPPGEARGPSVEKASTG